MRDVAAPPARVASQFGAQTLPCSSAPPCCACVGAAWYGHDWWTSGASSKAPTTPMSAATSPSSRRKWPASSPRSRSTDNQAVHAGDLLVKLDDRDYPRGAGARRRQRSPAQQATLANLDANRRLQAAVIAQAQAELTATAAEINRTRVRRGTLSRIVARPVRLGAALPAGGCRLPAARSPPIRRRMPRWTRRSASSTSSTPRSSRPQAALAGRHRRPRHRATQSRLHRAARADRRRHRQPQRPHRRLCHDRRPADLPGAGARPVGRCEFQGKPARRDASGPGGDDQGRRAARRRCFTARWPAWRRRPARSSACCRRRTRPAISPRSCSASRCASCSTATPPCSAGCAQGSR